MVNLTPWGGRAIDLYDAVIAEKTDNAGRRSTLTRLRPRIEQCYARHQRNQNNLERLEPAKGLTKAEKTALYHCYDVETAALARMKHEVLMSLPRAIGFRCQYCGLDSTGAVDGDSSGAWDHYLPRRGRRGVLKGFAEFSIHPVNLVPCCAICNARKSDRWKEATQRTFINLYTDVIDQKTEHVQARIVIQGDEPLALFEFVNMSGRGFAWLFRRHCQALRLPQRYQREWRAEMARLRGQIRNRAGKHRLGEKAFLENLEDEGESDAAALGINHWKPTLYRALARSNDFVAHCLQQIDASGPGIGPEPA